MLENLFSVLTMCAMLLTSSQEALVPASVTDSGVFLVNREKTISSRYVPELRQARVNGIVREMQDVAATALEALFAGAEKDGFRLMTVSGYRSYQTQADIYARKLEVTGSVSGADRYVARPGASEHQLGLAMDVKKRGSSAGLVESFGETPEGKWLAENCWKYGFIIRYPKGWEQVTGYAYEPWHVRYVGKETAKEIYEMGVPLEIYTQLKQVSCCLAALEGE